MLSKLPQIAKVGIELASKQANKKASTEQGEILSILELPNSPSNHKKNLPASFPFTYLGVPIFLYRKT